MTRNETPAATAAVRCAGPGDALDAIPWMLGFHPDESLVMLCLSGPRSALGPVLRFDLLDPGLDAQVVDQALRLFLRTGCEQALLMLYTDRGSADPLSPIPRQGLLLEAMAQFTKADRRIRDAVVVRHGRWWSLLCDDPLCCAPEGTAVAHDVPSAIELTYLSAGAIPPLPSRAALVDSLVARPDPAVDGELRRLDQAAAGLAVDTLLDQLVEIFDHVMGRRGEPLEPAVTAMLIYLVQHTPCRDRATELPCADELVDAIALWREVYVATPGECRPQVGSVLAILAWAAGAGALATSICASVLEVDPDHALTLLALGLLDRHVRPPARPTRAEAERSARTARRAASWAPPRGARGNGGGRGRRRRLVD